MNRLKSSMQRGVAVAVALLIGVSGVALTAGSAAATDRNPHHTTGHKIEHKGWCKPKHPKPPRPTKSPRPTPSETVSPSPSETVSPSPTDTVSPSPSETVSPSPTETAGPTPSETAAPEPTGTPGPTPTGDPVPGAPIDTLIHTCDEMVFQLEIPADGEALTVVLTPNKGEAKTLSVKPGEVDHVSFATFDGLVVTPSLADGIAMTETQRAEHVQRRALHFRRVVQDGAVYAQPFSEGTAAAAGSDDTQEAHGPEPGSARLRA